MIFPSATFLANFLYFIFCHKFLLLRRVKLFLRFEPALGTDFWIFQNQSKLLVPLLKLWTIIGETIQNLKRTYTLGIWIKVFVDLLFD